MWSKENTPPLLVKMETCTTSLKIIILVSQKIGNQYTSRHNNTITGIAQYYYKDICSTMFAAALFVVTKTWKQHMCSSTDEAIKECGTFTQWSTTQQ